jgi:hypothetical protein
MYFYYIMGRDSSVGIATELRVGRSRDRIPVVGARFSVLVHTGPWGPPSLLYDGCRVFFGGGGSGRGVTVTNQPLPRAEVKERV